MSDEDLNQIDKDKKSFHLDAKEAILALLRSPDGRSKSGKFNWNAPIKGKTRLVKELFLISKETKSGSEGLFSFEFTPGPYGPSSIEVTNNLNILNISKEISFEDIQQGKSIEIMLTKSGYDSAFLVWQNLPNHVKADIYSVKSKNKEVTYHQLLFYVYRAYPEYTANSIIRDQILGG